MAKKSLLAMALVLLATLVALPVWAAVPDRINYQGKLTDSGGNPLSGSQLIRVFIHEQATGGTDLWFEEHTVTLSDDGVYNLQLGSQAPFPANLFSAYPALYLEVRIWHSGSGWEILVPRQELVSTAFAMKAGYADTLEGLASSEFAGISHDHSFGEITGTATDAQIPNNITINNANTADYAATADSADYATSAGDADTVDGQHAFAFAQDSEIMPMVLANDGAGSGLNADLLDGYDSSSFASSSHTHDSRYYTESESDSRFVNSTGDTISGTSSSPLLAATNFGAGAGISVNSGGDGVYVGVAGDDGIHVHDATGDGIEVRNAVLYGLHVESAGWSGVYVGVAGGDGVHVYDATGDGVHVYDATGDGIEVFGAGDNGLEVWSAGSDGVKAMYATDDGLDVYSAGDNGLEVWSAGDNGVEVNTAANWGVWARGSAGGGYFYDLDSATYTFVASGGNGILSNKTKNFIQEHPTDPDQFIVYAALEGGEASTYYRGTAQLTNGAATIDLPKHFTLVTEEEGLTVQVTPRADCNGIYVAELTTTSIVVRELQGGTSNARFDFFINGIRSGYSDYKVMRSKSELGLDKIEEAQREHELEAEREAERERERKAE